MLGIRNDDDGHTRYRLAGFVDDSTRYRRICDERDVDRCDLASRDMCGGSASAIARRHVERVIAWIDARELERAVGERRSLGCAADEIDGEQFAWPVRAMHGAAQRADSEELDRDL